MRGRESPRDGPRFASTESATPPSLSFTTLSMDDRQNRQLSVPLLSRTSMEYLPKSSIRSRTKSTPVPTPPPTAIRFHRKSGVCLDSDSDSDAGSDSDSDAGSDSDFDSSFSSHSGSTRALPLSSNTTLDISPETRCLRPTATEFRTRDRRFWIRDRTR